MCRGWMGSVGRVGECKVEFEVHDPSELGYPPYTHFGLASEVSCTEMIQQSSDECPRAFLHDPKHIVIAPITLIPFNQLAVALTFTLTRSTSPLSSKRFLTRSHCRMPSLPVDGLRSSLCLWMATNSYQP